MARHKSRQHFRGGYHGGGRGGNRGASASQHSQHSGRGRDSGDVKCHFCQLLRPRFKFPKASLEKYDKKVAAGNDPANVKAICFDCCNHPPSNVQDSSAPRHPIAPAAPQAEPRGRCVTCRVEYPLTDKFFTIGDIRITQDQSRTCYKCRTESKLREVTESLAIQEGWEDAAPEADGVFNLELSSEDDEAPCTRFEDLAPEAQEEARAAGRQFERLVTARYLTTSRVVRERLRKRFRAPFEVIQQDQLARVHQHITAFKQEGPGAWASRQHLVSVHAEVDGDVNVDDDEGVDIPPEVLPRFEFAESLALNRPRRFGAGLLPATPGLTDDEDDDDKDDNHDDDDDDDDRDEGDRTYRLTTVRFSQFERDMQDLQHRTHRRVEDENTVRDRRLRLEAQRVAEQQDNDLVELFRSRLDVGSGADIKSVPKYEESVGLEAFNATLERLGSMNLQSSSTTVRSSSDSTPTPNGGTPSVKRPKVRFETPVDPRRAMIEAREARQRAEQVAQQQRREQLQQPPGGPRVKPEPM